MSTSISLDSRGYAALSSIYDAALDRTLWRDALDAACLATGAKAAALMIAERAETPYTVQALSTIYHGLLETGDIAYYMENLASLESAEWDAVARQQVQDILLDDEVSPGDELDRRADYCFLREKVGIRRRLGVRLNQNAAWYDATTFCFDEKFRHVPASSVQRLQPLLPHLAKAVEMGRAFEQLRARYGAVLAVLDRVHVGLGIALASGELIVTNAEADRIFGLGDGVALSKDRRIVCRDPDQTALLSSAMAEAAMTAEGQFDRPEVLAAIPRPSGAVPILFEVAPLSDNGGELARALNGALVTLIDPENAPALDVGRFAELHGLTDAEREVCAHMVIGLTGRAIAERRSTSLETVKSQMSRVLAKAGARRRSELIRLVVRTLPPIG